MNASYAAAGEARVERKGPGGPEVAPAGCAELAQARAAVYSLLARVFSAPPAAELLAGLKDEAMLASLAEFGATFDEDLPAADPRRLAEKLAGEFARLFIGPGPHIAPFESVFVRAAGEYQPQLWGGATIAVADFYREAGLEVSVRQIPDHLGLELSAMAVLAGAEAQAWKDGHADEASRLRALERRFCQDHLLRWAPDVCDAVIARSSSSFYRGMAGLARTLMLAEDEAQGAAGGIDSRQIIT